MSLSVVAAVQETGQGREKKGRQAGVRQTKAGGERSTTFSSEDTRLRRRDRKRDRKEAPGRLFILFESLQMIDHFCKFKLITQKNKETHKRRADRQQQSTKEAHTKKRDAFVSDGLVSFPFSCTRLLCTCDALHIFFAFFGAHATPSMRSISIYSPIRFQTLRGGRSSAAHHEEEGGEGGGLDNIVDIGDLPIRLLPAHEVGLKCQEVLVVDRRVFLSYAFISSFISSGVGGWWWRRSHIEGEELEIFVRVDLHLFACVCTFGFRGGHDP